MSLSLAEILITGIGLSMDAFVVSVTTECASAEIRYISLLYADCAFIGVIIGKNSATC